MILLSHFPWTWRLDACAVAKSGIHAQSRDLLARSILLRKTSVCKQGVFFPFEAKECPMQVLESSGTSPFRYSVGDRPESAWLIPDFELQTSAVRLTTLRRPCGSLFIRFDPCFPQEKWNSLLPVFRGTLLKSRPQLFYIRKRTFRVSVFVFKYHAYSEELSRAAERNASS